MISRTQTLFLVTLASGALLLGGCLERKLKPLNPCLVSGVVAEISVTNIDKVDLLFMVDNSGSMKEEQQSLKEQFPTLVNVLTSGIRSNGDPFPPARDLHLGVVTSDMGLLGHNVDGCNTNNGFGDDGVLQNAPDVPVSGCLPMYNPRFIAYDAANGNAAMAASDFGCLADVGTLGCGYEQQLESVLKAVWPANDVDPATNVRWMGSTGTIDFLTDAMGVGATGHGDGVNAGFLRNDPVAGISLIALIVVTDEEDCSSFDNSHFSRDPASPYATQPVNLRCFLNSQNMYSIQRYVEGYRALRPDNQNLVIFAAIAGVPVDLVAPDAVEAVDFTDENQRNAFYQSILDDQRMQEVVNPNVTMAGSENLYPSCDEPGRGRAYPPRRLVEVARAFGESGIVQSICQSSFGPAMDIIIDIIAKQLGAVCLPRPLVRNSDGLVPCNVVWELPRADKAQSGVPVRCSDRPTFLSTPEGGRDTVSDDGGEVCTVRQLKVENQAVADTGDGWYYDNFSPEVMQECTGATRQRVTFTQGSGDGGAQPPTGVTVKLECLNETQSLANTRTDLDPGVLEQPSIGAPCEMITRNNVELTGDAACVVKLQGGKDDTGLFCHPKLKVCVAACQSDVECAAGWVCDKRTETLTESASEAFPNGREFCVNPTCGDGK